MIELGELSTITEHDFRGSGIVYVGPTGEWNELDAEGRRLQSRALEDYQRLAATIRVLLRAQPPEALEELKEREDEVLEFLHRETTWSKTVAGALQTAVAALRSQLLQLDNLYDRGAGRDVYVPDTNALLANPALEEGAFEDSPQFEVVLAPSVLRELDELKVNHRNEDVRSKAEGLIRRIGGYRRRECCEARVDADGSPPTQAWPHGRDLHGHSSECPSARFEPHAGQL